MGAVFDPIAQAYDRWYDSPEGSAIFRAELECLRSLHGGPFDDWLEVGVGTGRFGQALGIPLGVDPSPNMLALAARRGIQTHIGHAEQLPFENASRGGVLLALTLCFVADASQALRECHRVLWPGGHLLLGIVPADSAWGRAYQDKAAHGHPVYAHAHFRTTEETVDLAQRCGFVLRATAGTLFWRPDQAVETEPRIGSPCEAEAGFVGLLFGT